MVPEFPVRSNSYDKSLAFAGLSFLGPFSHFIVKVILFVQQAAITAVRTAVPPFRTINN
ncbi:hypothetical protein OB236_14040 [Paenibacillus sp. WQ 127069]|uniref:Uncharacterized protein n=1 Tax=Paenibacillus baimaensis TaxID=2982185 RepID=A0ABT2UF50_9BACL|nr:hypothetical protein [Paenibacillus sp. WQ 127069]